MKMKTLLAAAVLFFGASTAAFASVTFGVGSTPVTKIVATGHTEASGSITFTATAAGNVATESTINIQMPIVRISDVDTPVPITFPGLTQESKGLIVSGTFGGTGAVTVSTTSSNSAGTLVLSITPPAGGSIDIAAGATIVISGLRISPASTPGLAPPLRAQITSTQDVALVANQTDPIIVQNIGDALGDVNVVGDHMSVKFKATDPKGTSADGAITVREALNFAAAFQSASQVGSGATTSTNVLLTLSQIPPGIEIHFPAAVPATASFPSLTRTDQTGVAAAGEGVFDSTDSAKVYYKINGDVSAGDVDTMRIPFTAISTINPPLVGGRVTVSASFAPIGSAFNGSDVIPTPIPRYNQKDVDGGQIIAVAANNTALMFTHVLNIASLNFNCGFAIANTTSDPEDVFAKPATRQAGPVTFHFFPTSGGPITSYQTKAGSPGSGLDASGNVNSGRTYLVLLSEILAAAGSPGADFQGYIIVVTDFSNAHAISFVMEGAHIVQAQAALVMKDDREPIEQLDN